MVLNTGIEISQILNILKKDEGILTYKALYLALGITDQTKDTFDALLEEAVSQFWIVKYDQGDVTGYRISNNLLSAFPESTARPQYISYEVQGAVNYPSQWTNPHISGLVRRNQAGRSTCVGCASAYGRDLNVLQLGGKPASIVTNSSRYVSEMVRGARIVRDSYLAAGSFSAECVYAWSRELGGVPPSLAGSYLSTAVSAMKSRGNVLEKDWYTPLYYTGTEVFEPYPVTSVTARTQGSSHLIDGYAGVRDFNAIKAAIYTYGYVLMPINIYINYTEGMSGPLPDPIGRSIGSHALVFIGYSADRLFFLHSWEGWNFIGSISQNYWSTSAGTAYVVMDAVEKIEVANTYAKVYLSANIPCTYYVNGVRVIQQPAALPINKSYVIKAVPTSSGYTTKEISRTYGSGNQYEVFTFTKPTTKTYAISPSLENKVRNLIRKKP